MRIVDDIIALIVAAARAGSATALSAIAREARRTCMTALLLAVAFVLLVGALGLMIAALMIGLAPYLGAHWAAMIAAAASLLACGVFVAIAMKVSKGR